MTIGEFACYRLHVITDFFRTRFIKISKILQYTHYPLCLFKMFKIKLKAKPSHKQYLRLFQTLFSVRIDLKKKKNRTQIAENSIRVVRKWQVHHGRQANKLGFVKKACVRKASVLTLPQSRCSRIPLIRTLKGGGGHRKCLY